MVWIGIGVGIHGMWVYGFDISVGILDFGSRPVELELPRNGIGADTNCMIECL